jgi:hypothetical protein
MVAMARSAACPAIFCEGKIAQIVARAVLAGLIKKRFSLSGSAKQPMLGLPNC